MKELQQLAKPLSNGQIEAAARFWRENGGWETKEINQLKKAFPDYRDAIKVKAIIVNVLYGTNIIAISKVADCVARVLDRNHPTGPDLVEVLVTDIFPVTKQHNYSFSAKYAHFFINPDLPILDSYAERMVSEHLGTIKSQNPKRYLRFCEDIETLKVAAGLTCSCAELDAYLWAAGEYWLWKENPRENISGELRPHFERLENNPENEQTLVDLLGIDVRSITE